MSPRTPMPVRESRSVLVRKGDAAPAVKGLDCDRTRFASLVQLSALTPSNDHPADPGVEDGDEPDAPRTPVARPVAVQPETGPVLALRLGTGRRGGRGPRVGADAGISPGLARPSASRPTTDPGADPNAAPMDAVAFSPPAAATVPPPPERAPSLAAPSTVQATADSGGRLRAFLAAAGRTLRGALRGSPGFGADGDRVVP